MKKIKERLEQENHKVVTVSSNNMKDKFSEAKINQQNIEDFLAGKYRVLITTNLLSRGIDMRKVTFVVNYELPKSYLDRELYGKKSEGVKADLEVYLHRVGRTGRFGDHGIALNFVTDPEQQEIHRQIREFYKMKMSEITMDGIDKLDTLLDEISNFNTIKREEMEEQV